MRSPAFYAFRTRRWIWGGLAGAVATATRVNGILMLPALAWIAWRTAADRREQLMATAGLALVTTASVCIVSTCIPSAAIRSNGPRRFERWGYYPGGSPLLAPVRLVRALVIHPYAFLAGEPTAPYDTLNGLTGLAVVCSLPFVWRRFGSRLRVVHGGQSLAAAVVGPVRRVGQLLLGDVSVLHLAGEPAVARDRPWLVVLFAVLYTLCFALFVTLHPLYLSASAEGFSPFRSRVALAAIISLV